MDMSNINSIPSAILRWITTFVDSQSFYCCFPSINKHYRDVMHDPLTHQIQSKTRLSFTDLSWKWFGMNSFTMNLNSSGSLSSVEPLSDKVWWKECSQIYKYQRLVTQSFTKHCPNQTLYGQRICYELPWIFKALLVDRLTVNIIYPIVVNNADSINRFHLLQHCKSVEPTSAIRFPKPYTLDDSAQDFDESFDWFRADEFVWLAGKGPEDAEDFSSWALFIGRQLHDTVNQSVTQRSLAISDAVFVDLDSSPIIRFNNHPCFGSSLFLQSLSAQDWVLSGAMSDRLSACEIDRLERWIRSESGSDPERTFVPYQLSQNVATEADRVVFNNQNNLITPADSNAMISENTFWEQNGTSIKNQLRERDVRQDDDKMSANWQRANQDLISYQYHLSMQSL